MMIGLRPGEPEQPGELVGDTFVMTVKDLAVGQVQQVRCELANTGRRPRLTAVSVSVSFAGVRRRPSLITFGPKPKEF
jgi:hypothetical protein